MMQLLLTLVVGFASPTGSDLYIKADAVHIGTGEILTDAVIHVREGRIVSVGKEVSVPAGARVMDLSGHTVMPGMVEGVTHAGLPGGSSENEEGRECTASFRAADALDATRNELARTLRMGVTSMAVQPGVRNVVGGLVCWAKPRGESAGDLVAREVVALRITLGTDPGQGHGGRGRPFMNRRPSSRMSTIFVVRRELDRARNYRERRRADPSSPRDRDHDVLLRALDGEIPVHWLARTDKDVWAALRLAKEFEIPRSVILEGYEADLCAKELLAAKVPVLLGPLFHPRYRGAGGRSPFAPAGAGEAPAADDHDHDHEALCLIGCEQDHEHVTCGHPDHVHDETWPTCLGDQCCAAGAVAPPSDVHYPVFTAGRLWSTGVRCGFASGRDDAGGTLLDYARFAVRSGLPLVKAVPMITLEPARILGIDDRVGSIAAGKDADLVVLDGDPLSPTASVRIVLIDGEIAFDTRKERTR